MKKNWIRKNSIYLRAKVALGFLLFTAIVPRAFATQCAPRPPLTLEEQISDANLIFIGVPLSETEMNEPLNNVNSSVTFAVRKVLKGQSKKKIEVFYLRPHTKRQADALEEQRKNFLSKNNGPVNPNEPGYAALGFDYDMECDHGKFHESYSSAIASKESMLVFADTWNGKAFTSTRLGGGPTSKVEVHSELEKLSKLGQKK